MNDYNEQKIGVKYDGSKPDILTLIEPIIKETYKLEDFYPALKEGKTSLLYDEKEMGIRTDLFPEKAFEKVCKVLTYGAFKYAPGNYAFVKDARRRYIGACLRHIVLDYFFNEQIDKESSLEHLASAVCSLAFLLSEEIEELKEKK